MAEQYYYTKAQAEQVTKFVDDFIERLSWMKEPEGIDSISDKMSLDDGSIHTEGLIRWIIQFAMDAADDEGCDMHDVVASAVLGWAMSSFDQDKRDALKPIYAEYVK